MSLQEIHAQAKALPLPDQLELLRLLSQDVQQEVLESRQTELSWYGIGESDITDLSLRDEELLFERV